MCEGGSEENIFIASSAITFSAKHWSLDWKQLNYSRKMFCKTQSVALSKEFYPFLKSQASFFLIYSSQHQEREHKLNKITRCLLSHPLPSPFRWIRRKRIVCARSGNCWLTSAASLVSDSWTAFCFSWFLFASASFRSWIINEMDFHSIAPRISARFRLIRRCLWQKLISLLKEKI